MIDLGSAQSFNVSRYANCNSFTANNFIVQPGSLSAYASRSQLNSIDKVEYASMSGSLVKSYDASTCTLSAYYQSSTTIKENGTLKTGSVSARASVNAYLVY